MRILTEKEVTGVKQLRQRVTDLNLNEEQKTDNYLVRWLIAREHNLQKAEEMLRNSMKWRQEHDIDKILDWTPPDIFRKMFPMEVCGYTAEGTPVVVIPSKFFDMDFFWQMDLEQYIKYSFRNLELLIDLSRKKNSMGLSSYEFIGIYDLAGLNVRGMMNRKYLNFVQSTTKVFDENYPEILQKAYFFYTPSIFSVLFSMVKIFIPKRTIAKFVISGSDPDKIRGCLTAGHIPLDIVPPRFGGQNVEFEKNAFKNCGKDAISRKVSLKGEIEIDGFTESIVPAGQKIDFTYVIDEAQSVLHWWFKTDAYDIGFSVTFSPEVKEEVTLEPEVLQVLKRVESQVTMQQGSVVCSKPGKYTLLFDNSFSRLRSKTLHLKVDITKAVGN